MSIIGYLSGLSLFLVTMVSCKNLKISHFIKFQTEAKWTISKHQATSTPYVLFKQPFSFRDVQDLNQLYQQTKPTWCFIFAFKISLMAYWISFLVRSLTVYTLTSSTKYNMKSLVCILLLGVISQGYAFQCDAMFSGRVCGKYQKASKSLTDAVQITNMAMADAVSEIAHDTEILFQAFLPSLKNTNMKDQVIRLGKHSVIRISSNMTTEEVKAVMDGMLKWLKTLSTVGMIGDKEFEIFSKVIDEAMKKILSTSSNAYLIVDKIAKVKEALKNALSGVSFITRTLILKAVDRFNGRLDQLSTKLCSILTAFGLGDRCLAIKAKIDAVIAKVTGKVASDAITKAQSAIAVSEVHLFEMFEEIDKDTPIVKRGISDTWSKVQKAMKDLGDKITDATKKAIEEYKPKIKDALTKVKTVVIDGARKIIIEVHGGIVKILTDGVTGTSD
ncbi:uncharacterized protein LOC130612807 [Hydractinia symbiolongicarpus]|uniref:uncharacterized protein LOC130612807 n=1 Tax=Hydractinia symbiolongicarpus TaxID=13093 RepID=UPI0025502681|nr:uncharacterized protein LOC130612807 [Hydractinia symbiolongicarpus]